jgi:hypothetical protein
LLRGTGLATLLLFLYVTDEERRKYVWDMPWPLAAECNMITNKQKTDVRRVSREVKEANTDFKKLRDSAL